MTTFQKIINSNNDFSEMRKFQSKPLIPRCDICLKMPNPEGFGVTRKTLRDISISVAALEGVHPQCGLSEAQD